MFNYWHCTSALIFVCFYQSVSQIWIVDCKKRTWSKRNVIKKAIEANLERLAIKQPFYMIKMRPLIIGRELDKESKLVWPRPFYGNNGILHVYCNSPVGDEYSVSLFSIALCFFTVLLDSGRQLFEILQLLQKNFE